METDLETKVVRRAAELLPKLRENFQWHVAGVPAGEFKLKRVVEHRLDGTTLDWSMTFAGIKEPVKGDTGETAIAIPKPHHFMLVAVLAQGADVHTLAFLPLVARRVARTLAAGKEIVETHQGAGGGLVFGSAARTTQPEMWSFSWPCD